MNVRSLGRRLGRMIVFARNVPPGQLARRVSLNLRRSLRDRTGWPDPSTDRSQRIAADAPLPLFQPRTGMTVKTETCLMFTFIGRTCAMPGGVDWSAPSLSPRDQLWRMNLHYMEYLEEVDDAAFVDLIEAWIAANSPIRAGAWRDSWNSYALSLRVVVWMQQLTRRREAIAPAAHARITVNLTSQVVFLTENLETDIGGNHLIKNIKALIWAAAFFEGETAREWRALGQRHLRAALAEQVLPDGVHYELSPSYHAQVFADLLECRRALPPDEAPAALDDALRRMAIATADLAHPDGKAAQFNDAGLHMAYSPDECLDAYQVLFGARPASRWNFAFSSAGYFGRRTDEDYLVIDCGRIGPDALPAHAHGDILSFEWSIAGERIIVDPGVYEYFQGTRRTASRSAASHNTLCFAGADQAEFFGAFRCGRRPDVELLHMENERERRIVEGAHNGFGRIGAHRRRFEAIDGKLTIIDRIDAPPGSRADVGFLLHPEVTLTDTAEGLAIARGRAQIRLGSTAKIVAEDAVWWPDLGYEVPTKRLRLTWEGGSGEIVTVFELSASRSPSDPNRSPEAS